MKSTYILVHIAANHHAAVAQPYRDHMSATVCDGERLSRSAGRSVGRSPPRVKLAQIVVAMLGPRQTHTHTASQRTDRKFICTDSRTTICQVCTHAHASIRKPHAGVCARSRARACLISTNIYKNVVCVLRLVVNRAEWESGYKFRIMTANQKMSSIDIVLGIHTQPCDGGDTHMFALFISGHIRL